MAPPTSFSAIAEYVLANFIKGASLQKGSKPGFAHALKLSYNTIDKQRLSAGPRSLTYRYKLTSDVPEYTAGLLTALMDELSTDACYREGLPAPPGLSLQLQTELLVDSLEGIDELDIVNTVTKLGRTVSFCRTEFVDVLSQQKVAYSSHVKYMPTGSRLADWYFTNSFVHELCNHFFWKSKSAPFFDEVPLKEVLQSHLEFHSVGRATFQATLEHSNPFGGLHGGCHAMVMELVGESFAKEELNTTDVVLKAIQIDYLGAGKGSLEVVCELIGKKSNNSEAHVRVLIQRDGRVSSEGKLRFASAGTDSRLY